MSHTNLIQLAPICQSVCSNGPCSCAVSNDNSYTQYQMNPFLILTNSRLMLLLPWECKLFVKSASKL